MAPLVERHYVIMGETTTGNLSGVITAISSVSYQNATRRIKVIGDSAKRSLGNITDPTTYYTFTGSNVFLENGLAQVGNAITTDNSEGFDMMRLFANSIEKMTSLEKECGF